MIVEHPEALFAPVIARLVTDLSAKHGHIASLEPVSYEERSFSHILKLRYRCESSSQPPTSLFLKLTKLSGLNEDIALLRERVQHDFDVTRRVHEWMGRSEALALAAVRPIACYPEYLAMATEESQGITLLTLLEEKGRWFPGRRRMSDLADTLARVGQWIRAFQRMTEPGPTESIDELRNYVDHRLKRLSSLGTAAFTEQHRQSTLRHIDALGRAIDPKALRQVLIHGDMALGNILVSGDRVVVLDFAMAKPGNPLLDLTRAFVQLDLLRGKPQFLRATVTALQDALVRGFDPGINTDQPLFRLMVLLHRINHLTTLSVNRYRWAERLYNHRINGQHRAWLAHELGRPAEEGRR